MAGTGDRELTTWKAIAHHLGVSIRTAQMYEEKCGLPVRRFPSGRTDGKPRVWISVADLDNWRKAQSAPGGDDPETAPDPAALPPDEDTLAPAPDDLPSRRSWVRKVAAGAVLGAAGAAAVLVSRRWKRANPTAFRVEGATLVVFGEKNVELWRHTFPVQIIADDVNASKRCRFRDIDGDGRVETLFNYCPDPSLAGTEPRRLVCFDADGGTRWEFVPGGAVSDSLGRTYHRPYWPAAFEALSGGVVLASVHHWSFPTQVALLDPRDGRLAGEYWHRGHLTHLIAAGDSANAGILLGGVNDAPEYKRATLVWLDADRIRGSSGDPEGRPYFRDMPAARERKILFFPRTPVSALEEFNRVAGIYPTETGFMIVVAEGISEPTAPGMVYELDRNLTVVNAAPSGALERAAARLPGAVTASVLSSTAIRDVVTISR